MNSLLQREMLIMDVIDAVNESTAPRGVRITYDPALMAKYQIETPSVRMRSHSLGDAIRYALARAAEEASR